jgi:hypothetical protein
VRGVRQGLGWDTALFLCNMDCGKGERTEHEFSSEKGEYNEIYEIRCTKCHAVHDEKRHDWLSQLSRDCLRPQKAYLTKFPYFEPHSGELVSSPEHRSEVWRRMGLHEAKHGINERYNDEASHNLNQRRIESEKRRRDMNEKRRAFGRAPR